MANNKIQVKRTNVSGRTANVTSAGNAQYIDAGEFALNMADGILYTSNGSSLITVGANLVNQRVTNSFTIDSNKGLRFQTVNTSAAAYFIQQNDDNFVFYSTNTTYGARAVYSIFANSNSSEFSFAAPVRFNANVTALTANGSLGVAGQVLTSNGSTVYWSSVGGSGTVTSVATGNGLTGGPITTTGTIAVVANNGITANSTGTFVTEGVGLVVNSTGVHVKANTGIIANSTGTFVNWAAPSIIGETTANGASFVYANVSGNVNTDTFYAATSANVASVFRANSLGVYSTTFFSGDRFISGSFGAASPPGSIVNSSIIGISSSASVNTTISASLVQVANTTGNVQHNATTILAQTSGIVNGSLSASLIQVANSTGNVQHNATSILAQTNTTVNATMTAALVQVANSTGNVQAVPTSLTVQNSTVNSVMSLQSLIIQSNTTVNGSITNSLVQVANSTGNVQQTATSLKAQTNTTVNATMTAALVQVSNSTSTANLSAIDLVIGVTTANSTALKVGNTTITTTNTVLGGTLAANGGIGTSGQVLTSGAAGNVYWSTVAAGSGGTYMKGGPSTIGSLATEGQNIFRVNANTLNNNTTFPAGENAQATGPISVATGITLTIQTGARVSIV